MKMTDGSTNGRAVIRRKREEGEWRETRDNADSWAGLPVRPPLVFCLDLQVLDGTLTEASLENRNRCHKTLLRLGFASVMTPLEMSSMMFITKTCQIYTQSGIHHQLSCNLQNLPSYHRVMMGNPLLNAITMLFIIVFVKIRPTVHVKSRWNTFLYNTPVSYTWQAYYSWVCERFTNSISSRSIKMELWPHWLNLVLPPWAVFATEYCTFMTKIHVFTVCL